MELTKTNDALSLSKGYKQTEVGLIPEDWKLIRLGDYIKLKNGYALSGQFFSNRGPVVMTPGNFKIEGGLKFEERNTIRFSGPISKEMCFSNGDLIMVMTDLTPDCNLLGKSGIVDSTEVLLHNQRIGKIIIQNSSLDKGYLNVYFNSWMYSNRMKSTATGSTVRHTSVPTINNTILALPTLTEQKAIATALSDVDALISSLEKLIAKKKAIKQGAMQELLGFDSAQPTTRVPKRRLPGFSGEWEEKELNKIGDLVTGGTPSTLRKEFWGDEVAWITPTDIQNNKNIYKGERSLTELGLNQLRPLPINSLLVTCIASIGKNAILKVVGACNQQINAIIPNEKNNVDFLYYLLELNKSILKGKAGVTATPILSKAEFSLIPFWFPKLEEQKAIAQILSDMDLEIEGLEAKKAKYQGIKQGMMQELLTGKTRLV